MGTQREGKRRKKGKEGREERERNGGRREFEGRGRGSGFFFLSMVMEEM